MMMANLPFSILKIVDLSISISADNIVLDMLDRNLTETKTENAENKPIISELKAVLGFRSEILNHKFKI